VILGIIVDLSSEEDLEDEWKNAKFRSEIAKSSVTRIRSIKMRTYFSVGKLNQIA